MTTDQVRSVLVVRIGPTNRPPGEIAAAIDATDAVSADALPGELDERGEPPDESPGRGESTDESPGRSDSPDDPGVRRTVRRVDDEDDVERLLDDDVQAVLRTVIRTTPDSIAALADELGRPREAVEDDVEFLADLRILSIRTGGSEGELAERPTFPHDVLEYEAVVQSRETGR